MSQWQMMGEDLHARRMHLFVSSLSARGRAIDVAPQVVQALRRGGWDVTVQVTTAADSPRLLAQDSTAPFIGALGGDGYLSQVARGLSTGKATFVPLPGGRGNDLCRSLKIACDPVERARNIADLGMCRGQDAAEHPDLSERVRSIDAMWVHEEGEEPHLVMGVLSLGYEAHVNEIANQSWLRSGPLAYSYAALMGFASFRERPMRAIVDGVEQDLSGWVASVSNSGMFGGGIHFVPTSDLTDGRMELVHVGHLSKPTVLRVVMDILASRSVSHPLVKVSPVSTITFTEPVGAQAWADGDAVATVPFSLRLERGAIRVLT